MSSDYLFVPQQSIKLKSNLIYDIYITEKSIDPFCLNDAYNNKAVIEIVF